MFSIAPKITTSIRFCITAVNGGPDRLPHRESDGILTTTQAFLPSIVSQLYEIPYLSPFELRFKEVFFFFQTRYYIVGIHFSNISKHWHSSPTYCTWLHDAYMCPLSWVTKVNFLTKGSYSGSLMVYICSNDLDISFHFSSNKCTILGFSSLLIDSPWALSNPNTQHTRIWWQLHGISH